jgi:hypothetical protein
MHYIKISVELYTINVFHTESIKFSFFFQSLICKQGIFIEEKTIFDNRIKIYDNIFLENKI